MGHERRHVHAIAGRELERLGVVREVGDVAVPAGAEALDLGERDLRIRESPIETCLVPESCSR